MEQEQGSKPGANKRSKSKKAGPPMNFIRCHGRHGSRKSAVRDGINERGSSSKRKPVKKGNINMQTEPKKLEWLSSYKPAKKEWVGGQQRKRNLRSTKSIPLGGRGQFSEFLHMRRTHGGREEAAWGKQIHGAMGLKNGSRETKRERGIGGKATRSGKKEAEQKVRRRGER